MMALLTGEGAVCGDRVPMNSKIQDWKITGNYAELNRTEYLFTPLSSLIQLFIYVSLHVTTGISTVHILQTRPCDGNKVIFIIL